MGKTLENNFKHTPVLLNECLYGLDIKPDGIYIDGTVGGGGHSHEILKQLQSGKLIVFDKDDYALSHCKNKFRDYSNVIFVKDDFKNMAQQLEELGIAKVDGILLDLGVSSHQIDTAERGFSYKTNGRLDMRMDTQSGLSAFDVVNNYSKDELLRILYNYGEENFAKLIVSKIIEQRKLKQIETTSELVNIIESIYSKKFWGKGSVAKKTFQAIRIEVNGELDGLERAINQMIDLLKDGGRLAIITFHSLEDRIVKVAFKERSSDCMCDKTLPFCVCKHVADVKLINKKPIEAGRKELSENKRSASAKLRIVEKI